MKKILLTVFTLTAVLLTAVFVYIYFFQPKKINTNFKPELQGASQQTTSTVTGIIIPHFAPVSYMIEDALKEVKTKPDLIILIGPNHFESGGYPVITGVYSSPIPVRPIFAQDKIQELVRRGKVGRDDGVISKDHSMGTPLFFIAARFPTTPVVPIVLKYHHDPKNIEDFVRMLQKISSQNTLIVASLDFSHYLPSDLTPQKDAETQKYIELHDYAHISRLSNDYIDSPWTLITFLKYLEAFDVTKGRELQHINTGSIAGQTIESSTSFFTYIFE